MADDEARPAVHMRDLAGEITPLEVAQWGDPLVIEVPGFGHVVVGTAKSNELILRMAPPQIVAALAQPGDDGQPRMIPRDAKAVDGGWEVEILPNPSEEDRLVVCIPAAALGEGG